ncbi:MAG: 50S ribosomal protein L4 [Bacteroidales bacterium]|nr:50S ribosomal protein L4 [Bacteroidales bacterium]
MELKVYNISGEDTGRTVALSEAIFGIEPNDHAIYLDVKQFLANQRQGTHKSKERGEVEGSTRKIKRQKGTGTARAGSIKSPVFRGGGRVFGPRPRNYAFKLNKKLKQLARKSILTYKMKDEQLKIYEDFNFEVPSTKTLVSINDKLKINDRKTLIVTLDVNRNIYLSSRNLQNIDVVPVSELTTYTIARASNVFISEKSLEALNAMFN